MLYKSKIQGEILMKICMRLILLIFVCVCFPIGYAYENDPPVGTAYIDDISNYMQYNEYVLDMLDRYYTGVIPDEVDFLVVKDYCYWYKCALFGDPNFSVYLSLQYDTTEEYRAGIASIEELTQEHEKIITPFGKTCFLTGTQQGIEEILDDQILDGLFHRFEIVQYNEAENRVDIFVAQMWDGAVPESQKEILQQFVQGE